MGKNSPMTDASVMCFLYFESCIKSQKQRTCLYSYCNNLLPRTQQPAVWRARLGLCSGEIFSTCRCFPKNGKWVEESSNSIRNIFFLTKQLPTLLTTNKGAFKYYIIRFSTILIDDVIIEYKAASIVIKIGKIIHIANITVI